MVRNVFQLEYRMPFLSAMIRHPSLLDPHHRSSLQTEYTFPSCCCEWLLVILSWDN